MRTQKTRDHVSEFQEERKDQRDLSSGFLNVQAIASYLRIRKSSVYSLVEKKGIPHYRIGRLVRFKKAEIDEWMDKQKEGVIDVKVEAEKVLRSIEKRPDLNAEMFLKKAIDDVRGKRYTAGNGKPDQVSDLRKEA
jgi:excisionase family DNA binding protein